MTSRGMQGSDAISMRYDALVIGAGPVGSYAAGSLADQGWSVLLLEEHPTVGEPMQCGGIVSPGIMDLVPFRIPILNEVKGAFVFSPDTTELRIRANKVKAVVLDRTGLDRNAAGWAVEKGAELSLGRCVKELVFAPTGVKARIRGGDKLEADIVLGAEGPNSVTARSGDLPPVKEMISCYQVDAEGPTRGSDMVEVFTGERYGKGFFSWVIPCGEDRMRIGSGILRSSWDSRETLRYLMKSSAHRERFRDVRQLSISGGGIPLGMREKLYCSRSMVIGDAAGLAKPVSGGGIITGLKSARIAASVANQALEKNDLSERFLSRYQKLLIREVGKELKRAWKLRKTFMHLPDEEIDQLFSLLAKPEIMKVINKSGDIDYPGKIALEIIRSSPGALKYALRYLGTNLLG